MNARVGLPNEHLAPNHIDELKKPMYSTCIGLILKGYNDYEQNYKVFESNFKKVEVPKELTIPAAQFAQQAPQKTKVSQTAETEISAKVIAERKSKFWDRFKTNLIEIFSEDDDKLLK